MSETSNIQWTDATVNFWWGCTKVGAPCDNCYAETWDKRTGGAHWGLGAPRKKIASAPALIAKLNRKSDPKRPTRVFIQSMSDLFDLEVELAWFAEAWEHIEASNRLEIQIVTKRASIIKRRLRESGKTKWPRHAGLMVSVGDQGDADREVPRLLALKSELGIPWVGVSAEPLLGPIDFRSLAIAGEKWDKLTLDALTGARSWIAGGSYKPGYEAGPSLPARLPGLDLVIVGGESGPRARPCVIGHVRAIVRQCQAAFVPVFVKQLGSRPVNREGFPHHQKDHKGADPTEWPEDLRVQQFPEVRA